MASTQMQVHSGHSANRKVAAYRDVPTSWRQPPKITQSWNPSLTMVRLYFPRAAVKASASRQSTGAGFQYDEESHNRLPVRNPMYDAVKLIVQTRKSGPTLNWIKIQRHYTGKRVSG
ncbi:hypothetical protein O9993_19335 [Vibrio lentus]|nr:hypothetical protein [Vibrio lentus]